ncbi:DUF4889 domain-containing protein [Staphylococcus gallinarum]|uniref:DUF4889 domain-containing protein n=1 Tax=Staphylococcus gallinarum TaxID=1293 RepID=A0A2T4T0U9_STAGA|nr:DUF4889 domain-containing protein [Staphylococcus gallinarum]MCD8821425.1 DUF4889 domain-containing protein [Staphylococcus gallinarum]MCD8826944.1 DUF4889 domain-containing protein [Staphylococcus gallinarum]MCD8871164.1 DUF4889 domain-containing protein [Staphylococcus gallinarum]MCW0985581.1 DUF4889 domain-containing protein [Staphylococcus gallinarum]MEB6243153.1 DUF4889 domain-containing protein [Staphylococcus gallinarum]
MKNKKGFAIILSAAMIIVAVVLVIMMMSSGQKETYYGYMKNSTTAEKIVSEKDHEVEENIKLPAEDGFSPKHGDFVKLVKSEGDDAFSEMKVVKHDDVPHGLMMKIHDMGDMKGM